MKVVLRSVLLALTVALASNLSVQTAAAQPALVRLENTRWIGQEDLPGYGDLTFRFQGNGQVTMYDKDGADAGTYLIEGGRVTLYFHNGSVVYKGVVVNGRILILQRYVHLSE